jgi:hypothetical protein
MYKNDYALKCGMICGDAQKRDKIKGKPYFYADLADYAKISATPNMGTLKPHYLYKNADFDTNLTPFY